MSAHWLFNEEGEKVLVDVGSEAEDKWLAKGFAPKEVKPEEEAQEPAETAQDTEPEPKEEAKEPDFDQPKEITDADLIAAVEHCMEPNHTERLTRAGKPEVNAMEKFLGADIDADTRDRAQALYVAAKNQE